MYELNSISLRIPYTSEIGLNPSDKKSIYLFYCRRLLNDSIYSMMIMVI